MDQKTSQNPEDAATPDQTLAKRRRKLRMRRFFLLLGPLVVLAGAGYFYVTEGRIVSTDNAYVQADKVTISAEVSGPITRVLVRENETVDKDQPLFVIDDRSYRISLAEAEARRQQVLSDIKTRKVSYQQKKSELALAESDINFADKEYRRQSSLSSSRAVAKAQLDSARHDLEVNSLRRDIIDSEAKQILVRLEGSPETNVDQLAEYRLAEADVAKAKLDLERTVICAPFRGIVSKVPQVGRHVSPGAALMSLIGETNLWVEANVKETELTRIHPEQQVGISIDTFPDNVLWGTVDSISPATGSEFAIIPAQNASGNWVKVVQRIPVRIQVDNAETDRDRILRAGMSATVRIDTKFQRRLPAFVKNLLEAVVPDLIASQTSVAEQ
jgi:membrane fusion protein (multidrug efflux system)